MPKKTPAPKEPTTGSPQQLFDAIAVVKQLQDFIKEHGTLEDALAAVDRFHGLIDLTGGLNGLKEALTLVGK